MSVTHAPAIAHAEFLRAARRIAPLGSGILKLHTIEYHVANKTYKGFTADKMGKLLIQAYPQAGTLGLTHTGTVKLIGGF